MIIKRYWLKTGKGTYGLGNTQFTINDLMNHNEPVETLLNDIVADYTAKGIVFKNLDIFADQFIEGGISLTNTGGTGNSINVAALNTNNTSSGIYAINQSVTPITSNTAAIEAETDGPNAAMVLRADKNIITGNVLDVVDSRSGFLGDTTLFVTKEGLLNATTIVKKDGTSDQILLADGSTTSLSLIGGGSSNLQDVTTNGASTTNNISVEVGGLPGINTNIGASSISMETGTDSIFYDANRIRHIAKVNSVNNGSTILSFPLGNELAGNTVETIKVPHKTGTMALLSDIPTGIFDLTTEQTVTERKIFNGSGAEAIRINTDSGFGGLRVENSGTGTGVFVDNDGLNTANGIEIDNKAGNGILIQHNGLRAIDINSDSLQTSVRVETNALGSGFEHIGNSGGSGFISLQNNSGVGMKVISSATGTGNLFEGDNDTGNVFNVDRDGKVTSSELQIDENGNSINIKAPSTLSFTGDVLLQDKPGTIAYLDDIPSGSTSNTFTKILTFSADGFSDGADELILNPPGVGKWFEIHSAKLIGDITSITDPSGAQFYIEREGSPNAFSRGTFFLTGFDTLSYDKSEFDNSHNIDPNAEKDNKGLVLWFSGFETLNGTIQLEVEFTVNNI